MGRKYSILKKLICGFMVGALVMTEMPIGNVLNGNAETIYNEVNIGNDDEKVYDVTGPVIESACLVENGAKLKYGDSFNVTFQGYDLEGKIGDTGYCHVIGENADYGLTSTGIVYNEEEKLYTMSFEVTWNTNSDKCVLDYIRVLDNSGNYSIFKMKDSGFNVINKNESVERDKFIIKDVTLSQSEIVFTEDSSDKQYVDVCVKVDYNREFEEGNTYCIDIHFEVDETSDNYSKSFDIDMWCNLRYDFEKEAFMGQIGIYKNICGGRFNITNHTYASVWVDGTRIPCDIENMPEISINIIRDFNITLVEDMYFTLNGEKVESGFSANEDDEVKFIVEVSDTSILEDDDAILLTNISNKSATSISVNLKKKYEDIYEAVIPLEILEAVEWKISLSLIDEHWNYPQYSNECNDKQYSFSLYKDGECSKVTREVLIRFSYKEKSGDSYYTRSFSDVVLSERYTSFGEIFPSGLPEAPAVEGIEFIGWSIDGVIIDTEKAINIDEYYDKGWDLDNYEYEINIKAVYDKEPVNISMLYCSEESVFEKQYFTMKHNLSDSQKSADFPYQT